MLTDIETQHSVAQLDQWAAELIEELHTVMEDQSTEHTRLRMLAVVNQLFSLLPVQFDAKTCDEYLHEVIVEFPNWDTQVQALWIEQAFLYEDLREIRDQLEQADDSSDEVEALIPPIKEWIDRMQTHDQNERRLRQFAVNLDVGGGD